MLMETWNNLVTDLHSVGKSLYPTDTKFETLSGLLGKHFGGCSKSNETVIQITQVNASFGLASVELAFRLATHLRGLASTCVDFG